MAQIGWLQRAEGHDQDSSGVSWLEPVCSEASLWRSQKFVQHAGSDIDFESENWSKNDGFVSLNLLVLETQGKENVMKRHGTEWRLNFETNPCTKTIQKSRTKDDSLPSFRIWKMPIHKGSRNE